MFRSTRNWGMVSKIIRHEAQNKVGLVRKADHRSLVNAAADIERLLQNLRGGMAAIAWAVACAYYVGLVCVADVEPSRGRAPFMGRTR